MSWFGYGTPEIDAASREDADTPEVSIDAPTPPDGPRRSARQQQQQQDSIPRYPNPQARVRALSRARSPAASSTTSFNFPPTQSSTMDEETVQRLMEAAIRATSSTATSQVQSLKKPELPTFDKSNIDIWIKRVEAAYTRVNVTDPKLKFAHLESKFDVNTDPLINEFLFETTPTAATWTAFLAYLRKRYGRTTKQQAQSVINGTPRDGRTPSQLVALMKERAGTVTLDDILKEQLLKELPAEVHRQIVDKVDGLTFEQTGELADKWFDKEGKLLLSNASTSINNVGSHARSSTSAANAIGGGVSNAPSTPTRSSNISSTFSAPFSQDDAETDVNAVRFKQGQRQNVNVNNSSRAAPRGRGNHSSSQRSGSGQGNSSSGGANASGQSKVCNYHIKFGDKAEKCQPWCILYSQHSASKGRASH